MADSRSSEELTPSKPIDDHLPPRTKSTPAIKVPRPRWVLHMQAQFWRFLMSIGMFLHRLAPPHPPKHAFMKTIPAKISGKPGLINLYFYTPLGYDTQKKLWRGQPLQQETDTPRDGRRRSMISQVGESIKRKSSVSRKWGAYPAVLSFHGGGFTLGTPSDDGRWCGTVVDECNAVCVAVEYRLAPEHPFPTAVEDGVDAVIWVHQHAEELGIDVKKIALSGFSSGGNMAFSVPLRLRDEITGFAREVDGEEQAQPSAGQLEALESRFAGPSTAHTQSNATRSTRTAKAGLQVATNPLNAMADISIRAIVSWYPSLDYTRTREQRRATCVRKDQELSALFTDLFDESYLHPPKSISLDSPYLSPGVAPTALLQAGLPENIIMYTCEWDMLLDEGQAFHERLVAPPLNKNVFYKMVEGVPHGWDKAPNPWKPTPGVREHYLRACKELRRIFNPQIEHKIDETISAAPRGSVQFVR